MRNRPAGNGIATPTDPSVDGAAPHTDPPGNGAAPHTDPPGDGASGDPRTPEASTATRRYILTGAPGAGKTTILAGLREQGFATVAEAATDVIARQRRRGRPEPWSRDDFVDAVVRLQRSRQLRPAPPGIQVFDRSPVCTLALARYLGRPVTPLLAAELDRIAGGRVYRPVVFFVRMLGFIRNTAARRIGLADAVRFEGFHERAYRECGFDLIEVAAGTVADRVAAVQRHLR